MKKLISLLLVPVFLFSGCIERKVSVDLKNKEYAVYSITKFPEDLILLNKLNMRNSDILISLFEGLVKKDSEGNILPALAESWKINKEKTIYTFKIRKNAIWSDGSKITSKDFVDFFSSILNVNTNNIYDYQLFSIFGAKDYRKGKIEFDKTAIKSIDDDLLEIRLNTPCNYLLDILSNPIYSLRKIDDNLKYWKDNYNKLVFSGPYIIKNIEYNEVKIEKNMYYWDKENVTNKTMNIIDDESNEGKLAAFQAFKADFFTDPPLSEIDTLKSKDEIIEFKSNRSKVLAFNFKSEKIKDKEFRRKINNSIEREKICNNILKSTGEVWKFNLVDNKNINTKHSNKETKFESLNLIYENTIENKKVVEEIEKNLKEKLNLDIESTSYDEEVFINKLRGKEYDIALVTFTKEYKNPISYFEKFLKDSNYNFFQYNNYNYDSLVYKAKVEINESKQKELLNKAEKILITDLPIVPLYNCKNVICKKEYIYDIQVNYNGNILLNKIIFNRT